MPALQQEITEKFLEELSLNKAFSPQRLEKLRAALKNAKTPKADDFVQILLEPDQGGIK
jgi:hypothetical protein